MNIGSWTQVSGEDELNQLRKNGSIISPSIMYNNDLKLCHPVHLSPRIQLKNNVSIDKFSFINWDCIIYPNVYIGSFCSIGRGVQIGLAMHPVNWLSTHTFQYNSNWFPNLEDYGKVDRKQKHIHHKFTKIGNDVWIGNNALLQSGITIGHGAIIGSGAVVTKNVPPYAIVGGVPAKLIRYRFSESIINDLLALKWWELKFNLISDLDFSNIENCIRQLKELR